jgi:hypothetical protein
LNLIGLPQRKISVKRKASRLSIKRRSGLNDVKGIRRRRVLRSISSFPDLFMYLKAQRLNTRQVYEIVNHFRSDRSEKYAVELRTAFLIWEKAESRLYYQANYLLSWEGRIKVFRAILA